MYWSIRKCSVMASVWRYDLLPKVIMSRASSGRHVMRSGAVRWTRSASHTVTPPTTSVWVTIAPVSPVRSQTSAMAMPITPNSVGATCWKLYSPNRSSACSTAEKKVCSSTKGRSSSTGSRVIGGAPLSTCSRIQPRAR